MAEPKVLVISARRTSRLLGSGAIYEFEDAIARFQSADFAEILTTETSTRLVFTQRINTAIRMASKGRFGNSGPMPWPADATVDRDYDLCVLCCDSIFNIRLINLIRHARKRSKKVVVYVPEVWPGVFEDRRIRTQAYALVDHFFIGSESSVDRLAEASRRPVTPLPPAVDTKRFEPVLPWAERPIHVAWTGRRLPPMHTDLRRLVDEHRWFYYYDGFTSGSTDDPAAQREWLAYLMGRTRFSISHYARVDQPEIHRGNRVVTSRFFESAAAGAVQVGAAPDTPWYHARGEWPGSMIDIGVEEPRLDLILLDLARDEARMDAISRRNVAFSLRRNDWGHRWADIVDAIGFPRSPKLREHLADLESRARSWDDVSPAVSSGAGRAPGIVSRSGIVVPSTNDAHLT